MFLYVCVGMIAGESYSSGIPVCFSLPLCFWCGHQSSQSNVTGQTFRLSGWYSCIGLEDFHAWICLPIWQFIFMRRKTINPLIECLEPSHMMPEGRWLELLRVWPTGLVTCLALAGLVKGVEPEGVKRHQNSHWDMKLSGEEGWAQDASDIRVQGQKSVPFALLLYKCFSHAVFIESWTSRTKEIGAEFMLAGIFRGKGSTHQCVPTYPSSLALSRKPSPPSFWEKCLHLKT